MSDTTTMAQIQKKLNDRAEAKFKAEIEFVIRPLRKFSESCGFWTHVNGLRLTSSECGLEMRIILEMIEAHMIKNGLEARIKQETDAFIAEVTEMATRVEQLEQVIGEGS